MFNFAIVKQYFNLKKLTKSSSSLIASAGTMNLCLAIVITTMEVNVGVSQVSSGKILKTKAKAVSPAIVLKRVQKMVLSATRKMDDVIVSRMLKVTSATSASQTIGTLPMPMPM